MMLRYLLPFIPLALASTGLLMENLGGYEFRTNIWMYWLIMAVTFTTINQRRD